MPSEEDLGPQLSVRLTYLFKRALRSLDQLHDEALTPLGINGRELAILLLVSAREPESQQQLAQRVGVDRTSTVALIDALEGKGLASRRPDPNDRRRNVIELTPAGRKLLDQAVAASNRAEQQLLADLDPTDAEHLRTLLSRIARP